MKDRTRAVGRKGERVRERGRDVYTKPPPFTHPVWGLVQIPSEEHPSVALSLPRDKRLNSKAVNKDRQCLV